MNATTVDVLEIFAESAKPPSGRRHFDAEAGAVANRDPAPERDWAAFILARTERRGPDECWPWKGGARITVEDNRGRKRAGKRVQVRPSKSIDYARLIFRETRGYLPRTLVFSTCGETWCANPRHFSDKVADRPKRRIIIMGKRGARDTRPDFGTPVIGAVPPVPAIRLVAQYDEGPEAALHKIISTLVPLDGPARRRVLAAVAAFYDGEV